MLKELVRPTEVLVKQLTVSDPAGMQKCPSAEVHVNSNLLIKYITLVERKTGIVNDLDIASDVGACLFVHLLKLLYLI